MTHFPKENAAIHYNPEADEPGRLVSRAAPIKERHEARLLQIEGVTGVGLGMSEIGEDAITVYLTDASAAARVPSQIEGIPVRTEVTGQIDAY